MMDLMFAPLRKYAQFQGRARRSEFWLFWLFTFVVSLVLQFIGNAVMGPPDASNPMSGGGFILSMIFSLAVLVPSIAVAVRRLHDTDRSGWWIFIALIPIIGAIVLIIFYVLAGTNGPNKFGEDPKGPTTAETFS